MLAAPIGLSSHETLRTVGRLDWGRSEFRTGDSAFDKGFHLGGSQSAWLARLNDESRELFNG
jgi:hypothetical protein